jgi:hypothetical protein
MRLKRLLPREKINIIAGIIFYAALVVKNLSMKFLKLAALAIILVSCGDNAQTENSTPIDSTNRYGTAPNVDRGYDPADTSTKTNVNDTGTNAKNTYGTPAE